MHKWSSSSKMAARVVQYVVVRKDLVENLGWPTGALIAQCCHACIAAIHLFYTDEHTKEYLADLDSMHKVVLEVDVVRFVLPTEKMACNR